MAYIPPPLPAAPAPAPRALGAAIAVGSAVAIACALILGVIGGVTSRQFAYGAVLLGVFVGQAVRRVRRDTQAAIAAALISLAGSAVASLIGLTVRLVAAAHIPLPVVLAHLSTVISILPRAIGVFGFVCWALAAYAGWADVGRQPTGPARTRGETAAVEQGRLDGPGQQPGDLPGRSQTTQELASRPRPTRPQARCRKAQIMAIRDQVRVNSAHHLQPAETVQAVFCAQTTAQYYALLSTLIIILSDAYRVVVVTDKRILVCRPGRFRMSPVKGVIRELPRTRASDPRAACGGVARRWESAYTSTSVAVFYSARPRARRRVTVAFGLFLVIPQLAVLYGLGNALAAAQPGADELAGVRPVDLGWRRPLLCLANRPLTCRYARGKIAAHKGRVISGSVQRFPRGRVLLHA